MCLSHNAGSANDRKTVRDLQAKRSSGKFHVDFNFTYNLHVHTVIVYNFDKNTSHNIINYTNLRTIRAL